MNPSHKQIYFLYNKNNEHTGSTVMRVFQLSKLVQRKLNISPKIATDTSIDKSLVVLNKSFLNSASISDMLWLKLRKNILVADYVDSKVQKWQVFFLDGLIACSKSADDYYRATFPNKKIFHITHHVDPRIKLGNDSCGLKIGYFGELQNTVTDCEINRFVEFNQIDTSRDDNQWLQKVEDYNCHYAVRRNRDIDGFKPFLKGFIAAHCNAAIITQRSTDDAEIYLGEDYPFFVEYPYDKTQILRTINKVNCSYDKREWELALERMESLRLRTCENVVADEFMRMLLAFSHTNASGRNHQ